MTAPAPLEILKVRNTVGEGNLWDWRRQLLWWTDIPNRTLYPCEGLDERALHADPHAGDVFFYRTGVRGLREPEYLL
jgi:sugar lactone lactonase YvrE